MKKNTIFIPFVLILICFSNPSFAQKKQQYAVLINNSNADKRSIAKKYDLNEAGLNFADLSKPIQNDIDSMKNWLIRSGFSNEDISILSDTNATLNNIYVTIDSIIPHLADSALFVLYFSGHGQQIPDREPKDEDDSLDETLVLSKELWIDDEVNDLFANKLNKFKNIFIADACYTGTSYKMVGGASFIDRSMQNSSKNFEDEFFRKKSVYNDPNCIPFIIDQEEKKFSMIYFGATGDLQEEKADNDGSWLTQHLVLISLKGFFNEFGYRETYCYLANMALDEQCDFAPVYIEIGNVGSYNHLQPLKSKQ